MAPPGALSQPFRSRWDHEFESVLFRNRLLSPAHDSSHSPKRNRFSIGGKSSNLAPSRESGTNRELRGEIRRERGGRPVAVQSCARISAVPKLLFKSRLRCCFPSMEFLLVPDKIALEILCGQHLLFGTVKQTPLTQCCLRHSPRLHALTR
jgi:hypothetical protein